MLDVRLALSLTLTAVLWTIIAAMFPGYNPFSELRVLGWGSVPLVLFLLCYALLAIAQFAGLAVLGALRACRGGSSTQPDADWQDDDHDLPSVQVRGAHQEQEAAGTLVTLNGSVAEGSAAGVVVARPYRRLEAAALRRGKARGFNQHVVVAVLLAVIVLVEGMAHAGPRSGSWLASVPTMAQDPMTPEGYVFWLNGQPLQSDSMQFWGDMEAFFGRPASFDHTETAMQPGRIAAPFLTSLVAPETGLMGSVYAAFLLVNLFSWWVGSLVTYDLARRVRGNWWVGLLAGLLAATGLGFTYMVGSAMPNAPAYGSVAVFLWVMVRVCPWRPTTAWSDVLLTMLLTVGLGLFYSLTFMYALLALYWFTRRDSLRRIIVWWVGLIGLSWTWYAIFQRPASFAAQMVPLLHRLTGRPLLLGTVVLLLAGALAAVVWWRLPHQRNQRRVAADRHATSAWAVTDRRRASAWAFLVARRRRVVLPVLVLAVVGGGLLLIQQGRWVVDWPVVTSRAIEIAWRLAPLRFPKSGTVVPDYHWTTLLGATRSRLFDYNIWTTFPTVLPVLAVVGYAGLPRQWVRWCTAVLAAVGLASYAYIFTTAEPHPRLVYFGFVVMYLLAANGLYNAYRAIEWLASRISLLPRPVVRVLALAPVLACFVVIFFASNASLLGNPYYDKQFHSLHASP